MNRTNSPDISDLLKCDHTNLQNIGAGKYICVHCSKVFTEHQLMGPYDYSYMENEPEVYVRSEN